MEAGVAGRADGWRRGVERSDDAREIDDALRRLAGADGRGRHLLGRLAARLLDRRAHHRLGFVRLPDYARERLGCSARELQELARVARGLTRLPVVTAALAAGEISWSHARLLVGLATPDTERDWVARAVGLGVRALAAAARRDPDDDGPDEGEPQSRFHLSCPRPVRCLWRQTAEFASRMAGAPLPAWRAAEAIVAESLADGVAVESSPARAEQAPPPCPAPVWAAIDDRVPDPFAALAAGVERLTDPHQLDDRLRAVRRALQRLDAELGRMLVILADARLHRVLGVPSLEAYVRERLGCSVRRARVLIALERRARALPAFARVYRDGRLSVTRALVLLPVLAPATAAAWVARAREVTVRRLVTLVDWALDAGEPGTVLPPPAEGPLVLPPVAGVQMCARGLDAEISFEGPVSVIGLLRAAIRSRTPRGAPAWVGFAALLVHAKREWERQPPHRDPIFARDGWRCAVPACGSRAQLHDHHVVYRSRGGDHGRDNRITVCAAHHLRGIHGGTIRVTGRAPDRLAWAIGCRAGGPPLFRTHGDRYVEGQVG
jgi:hypothetical protein